MTVIRQNPTIDNQNAALAHLALFFGQTRLTFD